MEDGFYKKLYPLGLRELPPKTLEQLGVKIELATVKDWEDLEKIRQESIDIDPENLGVSRKAAASRERNRNPEDWQEDLRRDLVVIAKNGLRPIGMTKGVKREGTVFSVNHVYVTPDFRKNATGGDISKEMVLKVLEEIKKNGGTRARLWVKSSNHKAIKLYEQLGFHRFDPKASLGKTLEITGNRPDLLIGWDVMYLDLIPVIESTNK